mgnify:CR=1 FL=1
MTKHEQYSSPLAERYASKAMLENWSPRTRHGLWRRLWLALAEAQKSLGVPIPDEAIRELRSHLDDIDFEDEHGSGGERQSDTEGSAGPASPSKPYAAAPPTARC